MHQCQAFLAPPRIILANFPSRSFSNLNLYMLFLLAAFVLFFSRFFWSLYIVSLLSFLISLTFLSFGSGKNQVKKLGQLLEPQHSGITWEKKSSPPLKLNPDFLYQCLLDH